jgi:hypothetical protein
VLAATVGVRGHADVRLAVAATSKQLGEEKVTRITATLGVLASLDHDRLRPHGLDDGGIRMLPGPRGLRRRDPSALIRQEKGDARLHVS